MQRPRSPIKKQDIFGSIMRKCMEFMGRGGFIAIRRERGIIEELSKGDILSQDACKECRGEYVLWVSS